MKITNSDEEESHKTSNSKFNKFEKMVQEQPYKKIKESRNPNDILFPSTSTDSPKKHMSKYSEGVNMQAVKSNHDQDSSLFKFQGGFESHKLSDNTENDSITPKLRKLAEENKAGIKKIDMNINKLEDLRKRKEEELARIKREEEQFRQQQIRKRVEEEELRKKKEQEEREYFELEKMIKEQEEKAKVEEINNKKRKNVSSSKHQTDENEKLILTENRSSLKGQETSRTITNEEINEIKNNLEDIPFLNTKSNKNYSRTWSKPSSPSSRKKTDADLETNFNKLQKKIEHHPARSQDLKDTIAKLASEDNNILRQVNRRRTVNPEVRFNKILTQKRKSTIIPQNYFVLNPLNMIRSQSSSHKSSDSNSNSNSLKTDLELNQTLQDEDEELRNLEKRQTLYLPNVKLKKKGDIREDSYCFDFSGANEFEPLPLLEYDKFYKEKFYRDDVLKDNDRINRDEDEEELEMEILRTKLLTRSFKKSQTMTMNAEDEEKVIHQLAEQEKRLEKMKNPDVDLKIYNKDALLYKSRLLRNYFSTRGVSSIPNFCKESEKDIKGKEIIQFSGLSPEDTVRRLYDRCMCLKLRRRIYLLMTMITNFCYFIVKNSYFDYFSLLVILVNTLLILISDPTDANSIANLTDSYFLYFYTAEAAIKIMAFGFILADEAYLKEVWNILDFTVIVVGWVSVVLESSMGGNKIKGLAGLRAFRILRPLKTVKSIKGLKSLVIALIQSIAQLSDTSLVLFFFFLIFAIAGVQMWQGICLKRCMSLNYGYVYDYSNYTTMCSFDSDCEVFSSYGNPFICVKGTSNPNNEVINFDNTLNAFITVFIIATMEGWTDVWNYISKTFKDSFSINPIIIFFYFHVLLFIGGYYLINLFLAVTKREFSRSQINPKELLQRKNLCNLIKLKYDTKEKRKLEKKRKEAEARKKNKQNENLLDMKNKIKKETFQIQKNKKYIPLNYSTVKDIYLINKMKPYEIDCMKKQISKEEVEIKHDLKKRLSQIDKIIKENKFEKKKTITIPRRKGSIIRNNTILLEERDHPTPRKRISSTNEKENILPGIKADKILRSIEYTLNWMKEDLKKKKPPHKKKEQKIKEKKEREKEKEKDKPEKEENELTLLEDLSYEQPRQNQRRQTNITNTIQKHQEPLCKRLPSLIALQKNLPESMKKNIGCDLSFLSDLTEDDGETEKNNPHDNNYQAIPNITPQEIKSSQNNIIPQVTKKVLCEKDNQIYSNVTFNRPRSLLPQLLRILEEKKLMKKAEDMRKNFDLNRNDDMKDCQRMNQIEKRRSFLSFLQYSQENFEELFKGIPSTKDKNNPEMNLDISLYKEESIGIDSRSFSDDDMVPAECPKDNKVYDRNCDYDELGRITDSSRILNLAKRSLLDRNSRRISLGMSTEQIHAIYEHFNRKMNSHIVIDMNEPKKLQSRRISANQRFFDDITMQPVTETNKSRKSEIYDYMKFSSINVYKSSSVEKNSLKYPQFENKDEIFPPEERKMKKENVPQHLKSRKYYLNYLHNIIEKDMKIKDDFKVDSLRNDIFGDSPCIDQSNKLPGEIDPVYIFNDKKLNLKKYEYIKHKQRELDDGEFLKINNSLKNFPLQVIQVMPLRTHTFSGNSLSLKARESSSSVFSRSSTARLLSLRSKSDTGRLSSLFGSTLHRSKSIISRSSSSLTLHYHRDKFDPKYKRALLEKIYKKIEMFNYKTLSHYFLEDDKLYWRTDDKRREEEKEKEREEEGKQKEKDKDIEVKVEIKKIKDFDLQTNSRKCVQWSGQDVFGYEEDDNNNIDEWNMIISGLENFNVILWKKNRLIRFLQKLRYAMYLISTNNFFEYFIMSIVIINAVIMALDGNLFDPATLESIQLSNYIFNSIFIAEFVIKFIGLGPIIYFSDAFTYLDLFIIGFAILDMATPSTGGSDVGKISSQLSFLRVFRIFRVLRLTKLLRKMQYMKMIIVSITKSLKDVGYIILILIMFILIFQLLGMSLLTDDPSYQSFMSSFYITFQILTVENWNGIMYTLSNLSLFVFLYLLVWIFIGNYILFNLFVSILLQSFEDENKDEDNDNDENNSYRTYARLPEYFKRIHQEDIEKSKRTKKKNKDDTDTLIYSDVNSTSLAILEGESDKNEENEQEDAKETDNANSSMSEMPQILAEWKQVNKIFLKNECQYSLFIFSQLHWIRIKCMKLQSSEKFDTLILIMILLSTLRLIMDTFISGEMSVFIFDMIDIFFTIVFLLEMVIKIIALGFIIDNGSYLRDSWNQIDFVIVVVSIIDLQNLISKYSGSKEGGSSLNFLKVLRLLRTLRPLRFISHNAQLKLIITSLFESIVPILNVLLIVILVFFMASIVGMNLFTDLYHNCYLPTSTFSPFTPVENNNFTAALIENNISNSIAAIQNFCGEKYGGVMDAGPQFKFSNIFTSIITCYVLSNMEGWPDIMNSYRVYNDYYGLFFVIYIVFVSYFFLNLFVGIMFKLFNLAWSREKKVTGAKAERYYDFLKQILHAKPEYRTFKIPEEKTFRRILYDIAGSKTLDTFIMTVIILNMITMAMNYEGSDELYNTVLDDINLVFTSVFIAECILKLCANGISGYFYQGWNRFDFFVVVSSIVDLVMANVSGINASFLKSFQIIRVLRVLRVTRVLRLVKSLKSLEDLLQTLRWSMNALTNVFILMCLVICIFAILGCYLYDSVKYANFTASFQNYNEYFNFDNFYSSFILCFRSVTGENWPTIMNELANVDPLNVTPVQSFVYMIIMNFITYVIMLNLFLLVTLQQYDEFKSKKTNPVELFENLLSAFKHSWNNYSSEKDNGYRMKKNLVYTFFMEFEWAKLKYPEGKNIESVKKYVTDLKLKTDIDGYVFFHEVLFKIIYKQMGGKLDRKKDKKESLIIGKEETRIADRIKSNFKHFIKKRKASVEKNQQLSTFNPLTSHLYFKVSFLYLKTIIEYYREISKNEAIVEENFDFQEEEEPRRQMQNRSSFKSLTRTSRMNMGDEMNDLRDFFARSNFNKNSGEFNRMITNSLND